MQAQSEKKNNDLKNITSPVMAFNNVYMIFTKGLRKPVQALQGMELDISTGCIVGLLGPNGCGKTTAVSCLLGLLYPQKGNVYLFGKPVRQFAGHTKSNTVGVVLEDTRLPPFLTVKNALEIVCKIRQVPIKQIPDELERIMEATAIDSIMDLRINGLSKGQARKVGVAAALAGDPPVLIMDEPASGLDISARIEFNNLIRRLNNGKRTILITSHLLSDVENTCTHIAIMQEGQIIVFDETQHLISLKGENDVDIFIHEKHVDDLDRLGLSYSQSKYPQLMVLHPIDVPTYETLGILSSNKISPRRIEPRKNLINYYLSITENKG